ncbi:MAG: hypothetical protein AB8C46_11700 [Burkholderiaceae bacterium]
MMIDFIAWFLGLVLLVSGSLLQSFGRRSAAIAQSNAWTHSLIAGGAAVIGLALAGTDTEIGRWHSLFIVAAGFVAAAALICGLLNATPGKPAISRPYQITLPALAALVTTLTCAMLAVTAPESLVSASLGLLAIFSAVAARLALTIAYRQLCACRYTNCLGYGVQAVAIAWLGIAVLSPVEDRLEMGLTAGALLSLSIAWAIGLRLVEHRNVTGHDEHPSGLPDQSRLDSFLSDYFRHNQPDGVILLKFEIAEGPGTHDADVASDLSSTVSDVGSVLQQNFRTDDFVATAGGRVFLVACPGLQPDIAQALGERACQAVRRASFVDHLGAPLDVTLLVGSSSICASLHECETGWRQADVDLSDARTAAA